MEGLQEQPKKKIFDDLETKEEKLIELTRLRTNAFVKAVDAYNRDTFENPHESFEGTLLPSWNSINASTQNFMTNVKHFTDFLENRESDDARQRLPTEPGEKVRMLKELSVYPNEKFPSAKGYNDPTLGELLRKRPDPAVSAWEARMVGVGEQLEKGTNVNGTMVYTDSWAKLWDFAAMEAQRMVHEQPAADGDDGEEEDEDEEMTDVRGKGAEVGEPMVLEHVLSFMSSGYIPPPLPKDDPRR